MSTPGLDPRVAQIARLFEHSAWADAELAGAVSRANTPADALREYAHVVGVEELWLSRVQHRPSEAAIWPAFSASDAAALATKMAVAYTTLVSSLNGASLDAPATYTNSKGQTFATPLGDILLHVALHGQYHRGKVNQMLRQGGADPAPVDFISFARGVPAATQPPAK